MGHSKVTVMWDLGPTSEAQDLLGYMNTANLDTVQDDIFKMLKDLLNQGIKPAIKAQTRALERILM